MHRIYTCNDEDGLVIISPLHNEVSNSVLGIKEGIRWCKRGTVSSRRVMNGM